MHKCSCTHKHSLCEHVVLIPAIPVLRRLRVRERTHLYVKEKEIHFRVRDGSGLSHEALGPGRCTPNPALFSATGLTSLLSVDCHPWLLWHCSFWLQSRQMPRTRAAFCEVRRELTQKAPCVLTFLCAHCLALSWQDAGGHNLDKMLCRCLTPVCPVLLRH